MKPIIILPPDAMSADDIKGLIDNEICVVVAKEPARVKFVDPLPCISSRTEIEDAAIRFSRQVLNPGFWTHEDTRKLCATLFLDILVNGTPLDPAPQEEVEKQIFDQARADELRRLAREEARAERAAAKALAASKKPGKHE